MTICFLQLKSIITTRINQVKEKFVFEKGRKIKLNGIFVKFTLSLYYYIIYVFTIDKNFLNSFRHTKLIKINQLLP